MKPPLYTVEENEAVDQLLKKASSIESCKNTKKMATPSPLAQAKKYIAKGKFTTTASYTTNVRCGHIELIKFIHAELGWRNKKKYIEKTVTTYNDHHSIQYRARAFPKPVSDREWHISIITKILDDETSVVVTVPCFIEVKEKEKPLRPDRVRAELWTMYKLTKISNTMTRVDFYAEIEFGGNYFPRWLINRELPKLMSPPTRWQEHFQHLRALRELGPEDGVAMGTMLTLVKNRKSVESRLTAFVSKNVALKKLKTTFPQVETMMLGVLRNKIVHVRKRKRAAATVGIDLGPGQASILSQSVTVTVGSTLRELSEKDAAKFGNSFAMFLLTSTEPKLAVDAWRLENSALQPLFDEHQFFGPMMQTIAKRLLASGNLGLKMRVFLGAFLSVGDLVSDMTVIVSYFEEGRTGQAYGLISMVMMNLFFQALIVLAQNSKKSRSEILRELFFVVTFLKPAVDAYRVATGYEDDQLSISPLQELSMTKAMELAAESIPGNVLQIYVFITNPSRSTLHLVSILISTMTTAFSSAVMSYDFDASPDQRKKIPDFYGFMGDTNFERTATFVVMFLLAGLHNLSKSLGVALLLAVSGQTTLVVLAGEMIAYHLVRLLRRDYTLFVPNLEGGLRIFGAIFAHVTAKTIVDFTGLIHFRGPKLVGGAMFLALTFEAQVLPFVAFEIYKKSDDVENKLDLDELNTALRALVGMWAINVLLFFMLIKRKYRKTFWDKQPGWQMVIATFENTDDAQLKLTAIFTNHISMSRRIKGNVIEYMAENWAEWERTKPSWFTPGFISKIPDEFIPQQNLEALGGARRRRSSVNSVRELLNLLADE